MNTLALPPQRHTSTSTSTGRDRPPARACGRRLHHTRRYVASLILLAQVMDTQALERLRHRARQGHHAGVLGLGALADTLVMPVLGQPSN